MADESAPPSWQSLHARHTRRFHDNKFVYPVLSRRSRGVSIGVNLNPDKVCNFDCIYCQVDRRSEAQVLFVEQDELTAELDGMLACVASGEIYEDPAFAAVPPERRRLNDIAFSGDGEPTTYRNFDQLMSLAATLKRQHGLDAVKLVLITNASMFHRPVVQRGLEILDANNGEIWAKLEAGTEDYYHLVERTKVPFAQVLENIAQAARVRPLVIQSLFMRIAGVAPPPAEIAAFCQRLVDIRQSGGQLRLVQVYTVARPPAESCVEPLTHAELADIARQVEDAGLRAEVFAD